jgi:uncharacterized tellurite resistance protein B-like protein
MTLDELSKEDRLRLMRFVCSFAWADLHVEDKERKLVRKLVQRLKLSAAEAKQVEQWLKLPPRPEEVDPGEVPRQHRELFLNAAREMIVADGEVHPEEEATYSLLEQLLR